MVSSLEQNSPLESRRARPLNFFQPNNYPLHHRSTILSDIEQQFESRLFISVYTYLGVKKLAIMACPPHTNERVRQYNRALVLQPGLYVAIHGSGLDREILALTYAYTYQARRSTSATPFC